MKVLLITDATLKKFRLGNFNNFPRIPLLYPFYYYLKENNLDVKVISSGIETEEGYRRSFIFRYYSYLRLLPLIKYISSFDVIISYGFSGVILSYLLGNLRMNNKLIILVYSNKSVKNENVLYKLKDIFSVKGLMLSSALLYMTRIQIEEAKNELNFPPQKLHYLPMGVDTTFFTPTLKSESNLISERLRSFKGKKYVVVSGDQLRDESKILNIIKDTDIKLVRLTQSLKIQRFWQDAQLKNNIDVFCKALLSYEEVRFAYQNALCLLNLADSSWQPAGWTTTTEAMACGIPVIIKRGLVTEEMKLYSHSPPFLEVSSSEIEIKEVLLNLIRNEALVKSMGQAAREFVEKNFKIDITGRELLSVIQQYAPISKQ